MRHRRPPRPYWLAVIAAILLYRDGAFFPRPPWHEVVRWLAVALIVCTIVLMVRSKRGKGQPSGT